MAVHNNSSEEDYLDSLLKEVLNDSDENKHEELNNEEELLGEIEDDLFDGDISSIEALDFENTVNDEVLPEEKPKKEKLSFFGRKKKDRKQTDKGKKTDIKFEEAEDFDNSLDFMEALQGDTLSEEETLTDNVPEQQEMSIAGSETFEEEDMQGLYDILGVNATEEEQDSEEINRLEEEKPKKRSKKQNKAKDKKKKHGFGRKKANENSEDEILESDLDLGFNFSGEGINDSLSAGSPDEELSDTPVSIGSGMEDMGLGGFEDIFMGGDETESQEMYGSQSGMSDDYDDEDISDDEEKPKKEKKKKGKKEKKEKKKKEKKPKKEKPKKEKKNKKPKKPKEPDQIIHISIPFIIFSISVIILIVAGLKLGGNYRYYMEKTDAALTYYLNKDFDAAYNELLGLDMNDEDLNFYKQVETIMYVERHYTSYKSLYSLKKYDQALNTLLRGVKMYDKYKDTAREYNCYDDLTLVLEWIDTALQEKYGLTESEARELNLITDQYVYAEKVYELADVAEAREKELEEALAETLQPEN